MDHTPDDHLLCWPPDAEPDRTPFVQLTLMPERAAFEPESRTLFVADVHLGKAAVFRARGLPVPQGTTTATLNRLSQALIRSQATRLVVLGDFLHARESHATGTLAALSVWRDRHPKLDCRVVEGNHDLHAGRLHDTLGIQLSAQPYAQGLLRGLHHPPVDEEQADWPNALTLAGHIHPVVRLRGRTDTLRLPIFWLRRGVLTLPAFGEFTGGFEIRPTHPADERLFVVSQCVTPLTPLTPKN